MYNTVMDTVKWRLKDFLDRHGLSTYQLVDKTHGKLSRTGVYRLTDNDLKGVRFESLAAIIPALRELTGEEVQISDLLEYDEGTTTPPKAKKKTWRDLAGAFDDPASPDDMAENHDHYLGEAESEEYDRMTLQGER